jgi:hypothetical protein
MLVLDLDTLEVSRNGASAGYLHRMQWLTTRPSHANLEFTTQELGPAPRAHIEIVNYLIPEARSARVSLPDMNKSSTITAPKKLNILDAAYTGSIRNALTSTLGLDKVLLVAHNMQFQHRWRFSPDVKTANYNGLFHCDASTNMWYQVHNAFVEDQLAAAFKKMTRVHVGSGGDLTADDRKYLNVSELAAWQQ